MLSTTRELTVVDLLEYGEEETAKWIGSCSDEDFIRVCGVADWIMLYGPKTPSGASMLTAFVVSAAAVFICEGAPRKLARSRRRKLSIELSEQYEKFVQKSSPSLVELREKGDFYGVTKELMEFWGE